MRSTNILLLGAAVLPCFTTIACAEAPDDPADDNPAEEVGEAAQPLLGSAYAQIFGKEFGTPDFGNGDVSIGKGGIATGDLDGDGAADMVVGLPFDNAGAVLHTGAVDIFWGKKEDHVAEPVRRSVERQHDPASPALRRGAG